MTDKKQTKIEEAQPVEKTFTEKEVQEMLAKNRDEIRQEAIKAMAEKQAEIKGDLLKAGSDAFYNISKWEVMKTMATDMAKSGAIPLTDNAFTLIMKMQAGREMGLKPIESIKSFYVVKGVLNIYGDAVIRRLREHGWTLMPYKEDAGSCTATICKGDEKYSETFTFAEAEKSHWTKGKDGLKPGWFEGINRKRKLRYGAVSTLIKTYVPEVLGSAVDIAEVAEDTVPLYNGSNATTAGQGLSTDDLSKPATPAQKNLLKIPEDQELTFGEAVQKIKELTK